MIRIASPSDVDAIAHLQVKAWQAAYRGHMPDAYLDALDTSKRAALWAKVVIDPKHVVLVATAEAALVGFCTMLPSRDADAAPDTGEISALYVDPAVWHSGFGSALMSATIEAAKPRNLRDLSLWVLSANSGARAFYEARGFKADGHTKTEQLPGFALHEARYRRSIAPAP